MLGGGWERIREENETEVSEYITYLELKAGQDT